MYTVIFDLLNPEEKDFLKKTIDKYSFAEKVIIISDEDPGIHGVEIVPRKNVGKKINSLIDEGFSLIFASPGAIPYEKLPEKFKNYPGCWVYSDYNESGSLKELFDYNGDFTERFDFGHIIAINQPIRVRALDRLNYAYLYDLKLKLLDSGGNFIHLKEPLYSMIEVEDDELVKKLHSRSFRYLFYKPEEELEYEKVFKDFLLRNDAFLDGQYERVYDPVENYDLMVSVVIPVLNRAKFIGTAIESVLNQDFDSYEVIVVDNGSTDGTQDVVRKYMDTGKVKLYQNPTGTIALALNTGVKNARGKYISQLD